MAWCIGRWRRRCRRVHNEDVEQISAASTTSTSSSFSTSTSTTTSSSSASTGAWVTVVGAFKIVRAGLL